MELFKDTQNPVPDSSLEKRNAAVLRAKELINRDTEFYQKLQARRNERAEKNRSSGNVSLYIPGRIIHLMDMNGDDQVYVPYWASKYEFNEIFLSDRMLSDHGAYALVDVLKDIALDQISEITSNRQFFQSVVVGDKDEIIPETKARYCSCLTRTNSRISFALAILVSVALLLNYIMDHNCDFFTHDVTVLVNGTILEEPGMDFGLFSYELKRCADINECNTGAKYNSTFVDTGICAPFPPSFQPDGYLAAARAW